MRQLTEADFEVKNLYYNIRFQIPVDMLLDEEVSQAPDYSSDPKFLNHWANE